MALDGTMHLGGAALTAYNQFGHLQNASLEDVSHSLAALWNNYKSFMQKMKKVLLFFLLSLIICLCVTSFFCLFHSHLK